LLTDVTQLAPELRVPIACRVLLRVQLHASTLQAPAVNIVELFHVRTMQLRLLLEDLPFEREPLPFNLKLIEQLAVILHSALLVLLRERHG